MSELNRLANVLEQHFATTPSSSFVHFAIVSDDLTGEETAHVPGERFNSIWAITNHMAFWMDYTRAAFLDEDVDLTAWGMDKIGNGWPPLGAITDDAWQAARQQAMEICCSFAAVVRTLDPAYWSSHRNDSWVVRPIKRFLHYMVTTVTTQRNY